jgi:hypothetical protein
MDAGAEMIRERSLPIGSAFPPSLDIELWPKGGPFERRYEPVADAFTLDDDSPVLFSVRSGASGASGFFDIVDRVNSGFLRRRSTEGTLI